MARLRKRYAILSIAMGFGFYWVGRDVGTMGDLQVARGSHAGALPYHLGALGLILAALACFIFAVVIIVRGFGGGAPSPPREIEPLPRSAAQPMVSDDASFDPDAIMARYLAQREPAPRTPTPSEFGRKRV